MFGIKLDRLVEIVDGLVVFFLVEPDVAAIVIRQGVFGVEFDRLVIVGDRLGVFVFLAPGVAAIVVDDRMVGLEFDRLVIIGEGAIDFVPELVKESAPEVGVGGRLRLNRVGIEVDRLVRGRPLRLASPSRRPR